MQEIECNLEFKYNEYTSKLNFDNTILHSKPFIIKRAKSSKSAGPKDYISIAFKFQNVDNMLFIYDYFIHNRLYCYVKFYFPEGNGRDSWWESPEGIGLWKLNFFFRLENIKHRLNIV